MAIVEHTGRRALTVNAGEIVAVLGAPGSGKSRLALELAFLARPAEGEVLFHGQNPMQRRRSWNNRPAEVTLLVQNAEDQLFARTVFDDVAFGPRHVGVPEDDIERRVLRALAAVGLDPAQVRERSPFALSGGERRRVALAGVIAMEPEVLVLDEPTSNLDPRTREEFVDLLEPLRGRSGVIWLTSSAAEAARADQVYLLRDGATAKLGRGSDLLADWRELAAAGIELPAVYALAAEMDEYGWSLPESGVPAEMEHALVDAWKERHLAG